VDGRQRPDNDLSEEGDVTGANLLFANLSSLHVGQSWNRLVGVFVHADAVTDVEVNTVATDLFRGF